MLPIAFNKRPGYVIAPTNEEYTLLRWLAALMLLNAGWTRAVLLPMTATSSCCGKLSGHRAPLRGCCGKLSGR
jgi:hypothetical protein